MAATEQLLFPLRHEIIGHDKSSCERSRTLCCKCPHHHDRLDRFAEADLVREQPAASGARHHSVHAVDLVRIGESADAECAEQRLIAINPPCLGVEAKKNAVEVGHCGDDEMAGPTRSAT